jgi:hypothetical protein
MLSDSFFGLVVFVSAYIIGRIISESSLRKLSLEQKAILLDAFSTYRIYSLIAVFIVVVSYLLCSYFFWQYDRFLTPFFFGLILVVLLFNSVFAYSKLRTLDLPASYIKSFWLSSVIQYIGVIFLFVPTLSKYFG